MFSSKLNGFYEEKLGTPTSGGCNQESLASNYVSSPAIKAAQNGPAEPGSMQQVAEVFFATNYDIVRIVQTATLI
jgi:hypothetical protein